MLLTINFLVFPGVLAALFVELKNLRITIEPVVLMLIPDQPGWCAVEMQILYNQQNPVLILRAEGKIKTYQFKIKFLLPIVIPNTPIYTTTNT